MTQPEPLRLADWLEDQYDPTHNQAQAAALLRRLVAQLDALLEALKAVEPILTRMYGPQAAELPPMQMVRAAIKRAHGIT